MSDPMSRRTSSSTRAPLAAFAPALLAALTLAGPAAAGDPPYVYAFQEKGRLYVEAALLETLPGGYDPKDLFSPKGTSRWTDVAVSGADRYALRLDGLVERNGETLHELPFQIADYLWNKLVVDGDAVHAVRSDGALSVDGAEPLEFPDDGYIFLDVAATGGRVYALRSDGSVFADDQVDAVVDFDGVKSKLETKEGKGVFGDSHWLRLVPDPTTGTLYSLRGDGQMQSWAPGDPAPTVLTSLPFPKQSEKVRGGHRYVDLEFDADGTFYVLRRDGRVWSSADVETELVDWPGRTKTRKRIESFMDLEVMGGQFWGVRWDGRVYAGTSTDLLVDLEGKRYVRLAAGGALPDMASFDNTPAKAAVYKAKGVQGTELRVPIVVNDVDAATDDLDVSVDLSDLPPAATYDAPSRTVVWPAPVATGKFSFDVEVDDGSGEPPASFRYRIRMKPTPGGSKNHAPLVSKVAPVQALVGQELVLPLLAVDPDGDALTVTPVDDQGAFLLGATWDDVAGALRWTPAFADLGKTTARLRVSDGQKTRTAKIRLRVVNPLPFVAP